MILYSINPRSLGTLPEWTAAVLEAERLGFTAIHLHPFHPTSQVTIKHNGRAVSGSLYGITDYFSINPEFCGEATQEQARAQLTDFIRFARSKGIIMVADLVFNYVAVDHPLVQSRPDFFRRNADGSLFVAGTESHEWWDAAVIDYSNPEAWNYFLDEGGHWLRLIDDYLALGFNGVRCDAIYAAPQLMWEQVLNYTLSKAPHTWVIAETMGLSGGDADAMRETLREKDARIIYDFAYDDLARNWNTKDVMELMSIQARRPAKISHYGNMGCVDDIAFPTRAAELRQMLKADEHTEQIIGATCLRDYAVACLTNNSVMMPRGFQWCIENNTGSFREMVSADFFKNLKSQRQKNASPLTLGPAIAEIHKLRAGLPDGATVQISNAFETGWKHLTALRCDFMTHGDERLIASIILLLNSAPEHGPQPFPSNYFQTLKENQNNVQRMHFGADRAKQEQISGVAILVVPGGLPISRQFTRDVKATHAPAAELTPACVA